MKTLIPSINPPRVIASAIFGALALSSGVACLAAESSQAPRVVVQYGDLNLSNLHGAAKLYSRIATAAHELCSPFDVSVFAAQVRLQACVHKVIADTVTKVGRPELFAVYNARNDQPLPTIATARAR
jgi:UrcA family protein